ncbi:MAG: glutamine synthetase family protein [Geminicoccaceae bacterium]
MSDIAAWIKAQRITEVECLVPDLTGIARGKILPDERFLTGAVDGSLRLPESVFTQTVTGDYPSDDKLVIDPVNRDVRLRPDPSSIRLVPWYDEPTAQVICDCHDHQGEPLDIASRQVLRRVLTAYEEQGWQPVVAPEVEFFLTKINDDPDYPLEPPIGRSRRQETGRQSYGIEAANEFDPIFEDVYDWCERQEIDIDTLSHEAGVAQMEINFHHGDPLALADQAFLFKRTLRQAALKHGIYATFMAKPMEREPGSSMHIHQSVFDSVTGDNLFAEPNGDYSALFLAYIGGLQTHLLAAMPLLAPNVNSYRRLRRDSEAPINNHWGWENRTVGLRVPESDRQSRRVENRVAGADANPYLAIAASLACGYLGMVDRLEPSAPLKDSAYTRGHNLPRQMSDGLAALEKSMPLRRILGDRFVQVVLGVRESEHDAYQRVISSWEREHLLLNV